MAELLGPSTWSNQLPSEISWGEGSFDRPDLVSWRQMSKIQTLDRSGLQSFFRDWRSSLTTQGSFESLQLPSVEIYQNDFCDIQNNIEQGFIEKAVSMLVAQSSNFDLAQINIDRLVNQDQGSGFLFARLMVEQGMIGMSPEILFSWDHRAQTLTTEAVAGTRPWSKATELWDSAKDRAEQQMVVEGLIQNVNCLGSVTVGSTYLKQVGKLGHLATELVIQLQEDVNFSQIMMALHPTAALGVYPRHVETLAWIRARYPERGLHGAPIIWHEPGVKTVARVALRMIEWQKSKARLAVGCGVVKHSDLLSEYQELQLKFQSTQELFGCR